MAGTSSASTPLTELIDLGGRTALVTGAAMGIGLGIARRLHEAGANTVIADLDGDVARTVARELADIRPHSAGAVGCDVADANEVQEMVARTINDFGGIDILVNNAGIYPIAPLAELDAATFRRVLDVNLTGTFLCTQAVGAQMIEQGRGGRIVNITSIDALHPSSIGLSHYDASKHGAWGFTKSAALELAQHRIWVNAVAPGGVTTPGTAGADATTLAAFEQAIPMGRMGDPDEIGRAVLFLCSDMASYITGAQLVVDGGRLLV